MDVNGVHWMSIRIPWMFMDFNGFHLIFIGCCRNFHEFGVLGSVLRTVASPLSRNCNSRNSASRGTLIPKNKQHHSSRSGLRSSIRDTTQLEPWPHDPAPAQKPDTWMVSGFQLISFHVQLIVYRISMSFTGFQWVSMRFNGFQWISTGIQWIYTDLNGFHWISLDFQNDDRFESFFKGISSDVQWILMDLNGFQWIFHGFQWISMDFIWVRFQ